MEFSKSDQRDLELLQRMSNTCKGSSVWLFCEQERQSRSNFRKNDMMQPLSENMDKVQRAFDFIVGTDIDIGDLSFLEAACLWVEQEHGEEQELGEPGYDDQDDFVTIPADIEDPPVANENNCQIM